MSSDLKTCVTVTQDKFGQFSCRQKDCTDIEGKGASVLEAVGDWAVYSRMVKVYCEPPAVLKEYQIKTMYCDLEFKQAPERD